MATPTIFLQPPSEIKFHLLTFLSKETKFGLLLPLLTQNCSSQLEVHPPMIVENAWIPLFLGCEFHCVFSPPFFHPLPWVVVTSGGFSSEKRPTKRRYCLVGEEKWPFGCLQCTMSSLLIIECNGVHFCCDTMARIPSFSITSYHIEVIGSSPLKSS